MAQSAFSQDSSVVTDATYITLGDETASFANSFSLGSLTTGLLLNTVAAGVSTVTMTTTLPDGFVATTQTSSDNSTKVATTAYVDASGGGGISTGKVIALGMIL